MKKILQRLGAFGATAVLVGSLAAPAWAGGTDPVDPTGKCNAGRGNLSETTPATDCDPGNSGLNNRGGD